MSWNEMKKAKEEGGGLYLKLKDGEAVEGVFVGEPYCYFAKFGDKTEYDKWSEGLSFRFKINFVTRGDNGEPVAKIFQQGSSFRDQLLDAIAEYGQDCIYKIKRTGSGKDDTRYAILFKAKLPPEQAEKIKSVRLNAFKKTVPGRDVEPGEHEPREPGDEAPW